MTLFSVANLYLGWDSVSFCDITIHLGRLRLELGGPRRNHGPSQTYTHQPTNGARTQGR